MQESLPQWRRTAHIIMLKGVRQAMKNQVFQSKDKNPNEISLLVSILIRYPEISSLHFDPKSRSLAFNFLVRGLIPQENLRSFRTKLSSCLDVFHQIGGDQNHTTSILSEDFNGVTRLIVAREVDTLSQHEISLIIHVIYDHFTDKLVSDYNDSILEEELLLQEEMIDSMLLDVSGASQEKDFIAYREDGRVMVFNK